jgi:hypothetical protein
MVLSQQGQIIGLHPIGAPPAQQQQAQPQQPPQQPGPSLIAGAAADAAQQQQQQQYVALSSADGQAWPEPSSSSGRAGCPVFVMLPLDTVWVVEREGHKVRVWF